MAPSRPSEAEVDGLLEGGGMAIAGHFQWEEKSNAAWVKVEARVQTPQSEKRSLRIVVNVNRLDRTRRTFLLLLEGHRIRALCINGSHTNKHTNTEVWTWRTHKHRWTDSCADRFAYTPSDITATDIQGQLEQFCAECKIDCSVTLADLPAAQGDFTDDDL